MEQDFKGSLNEIIKCLGSSAGIGTDSPGTINASTLFEVQAQSAIAGMSAFSFSATAAHGGSFTVGKARGTQASPSLVSAADILGNFLAQGFDGSNWLTPAGIQFVAEGTPAAASVPTRIDFETGVTAATRAVRMGIGSNGKINIGSSFAADVVLHVRDSSVPFHSERTTAVTNTLVASAIFKATSSGAMADGFGTGWNTILKDDTGVDNYSGGVYLVRYGADNTSKMDFYTNNAGTLTRGMYMTAAGGLTIVNSLVAGTGFGCNGQAAQTSYGLGAACTDEASAIILANKLRLMAIANGMGSGS